MRIVCTRVVTSSTEVWIGIPAAGSPDTRDTINACLVGPDGYVGDYYGYVYDSYGIYSPDLTSHDVQYSYFVNSKGDPISTYEGITSSYGKTSV